MSKLHIHITFAITKQAQYDMIWRLCS